MPRLCPALSGGPGLTADDMLHWLQRGRPRKPSRKNGAQSAAAGEAQKSLKRKAQPAAALHELKERPLREDACSAPRAPEQVAQAVSVGNGQEHRSAATPGKKRRRRSAAYWSYPVGSRLVLWACMPCPVCLSWARSDHKRRAVYCTQEDEGAAPINAQSASTHSTCWCGMWPVPACT